MPRRPATFCPARCPVRTPERRPTAHERGYGARWQRYTKVFLNNHPTCSAAGCSDPATDVDHIRPISGPSDPGFWDPTNHQGLCHSHHSQKTAKHDRHLGRRSA
jgi:5-methylcytosine-specific restriction protein A